LGVEGPDAVGETYDLLEQRAKGALESVLVEQMIAGNRELMVGMKRDPCLARCRLRTGWCTDRSSG